MISMGYVYEKWHWFILGIIGFGLLIRTDYGAYKKIADSSFLGCMYICLACIFVIINFTVPLVKYWLGMNLTMLLYISFFGTFLNSFFITNENIRKTGKTGSENNCF